MDSGAKQVWLIYGGSGWIGGHLAALLREKGETVHLGTARLEDRASLDKEIKDIKPTRVLCAAGVTGRPNVDWCESNKAATIRGNIVGACNLADVCQQNGNTHLAVFGSGCIYEYDAEHPIGGKGFLEGDEPNYTGSFYSQSKVIAEKLLVNYPNVLILRLRMPISDDLHSRSFLTKITKYEKVVTVPNSISLLHDLLPISLDMATKARTGIYNFTNPGAISHNEMLALYKEYIDPAFTWQNFSLEEQAKILKAGRSNNELDVAKLSAEYPELKHIKEAAVDLFKRMQVIEGKKN